MYEFGEGIIIESHKVPWLIWIQLLITVLLVLLLLVVFSLVALDPSHDPPTAAAGGVCVGPSSSGQSSDRIERIGENQRFEGIGTTTSRGGLRGEGSEEREASSLKDASVLRSFGRRGHPCHYFGLAKQAFLKCLGLDSSSKSDNNLKHGKED